MKAAIAHAVFGDQILFSPGGTSFDLFKNFADRGEQFKKFIEGYYENRFNQVESKNSIISS